MNHDLEIDCLDCNAEGTVWESVPGGRFDMNQQQWYPDERPRPCERCQGSGRLWIEQLTPYERQDFLEQQEQYA